jgi:membrane associated rhomboid family serine protease
VIPLRDANPTRRRPVVTLSILALCGLAFAWELATLVDGGERALSELLTDHGVVPAELSSALSRLDLASAPMVDVVTSMFLHAGWIHLLGNLLYLWIFGNNVEDRLGRVRFAAFYLLGGVTAVLAQVFIDPTSEVPLIGASGAISAALGAYLVLYPTARIQSLVFLGFFYQLIAVPAVVVLGFWFVLQVVDGIASLGVSTAIEGGVAFFAHIGGFLLGIVVAVPIRLASRRP